MPTLDIVTAALEHLAPLRLAASWDSVGLLVAPRRDTISRVMTCLTLTPQVAAEAVCERADLVVSHHPLPFRPVPRITPATGPGRVLLDLIGAGAGIWSSHTAWDSAAGGINDQLARLLGLASVAPIEPDAEVPLVGFGRAGMAEQGCSVADLAARASAALGVQHVQIAVRFGNACCANHGAKVRTPFRNTMRCPYLISFDLLVTFIAHLRFRLINSYYGFRTR